jgi:hypothetical protein
MAVSSAFDHLGRTLDADAHANAHQRETVLWSMIDAKEEGNV